MRHHIHSARPAGTTDAFFSRFEDAKKNRVVDKPTWLAHPQVGRFRGPEARMQESADFGNHQNYLHCSIHLDHNYTDILRIHVSHGPDIFDTICHWTVCYKGTARAWGLFHSLAQADPVVYVQLHGRPAP